MYLSTELLIDIVDHEAYNAVQCNLLLHWNGWANFNSDSCRGMAERKFKTYYIYVLYHWSILNNPRIYEIKSRNLKIDFQIQFFLMQLFYFCYRSQFKC